MSALHEILPDIARWSWFSERFGYDFHGYFVRSAGLVIDPVEVDEATLSALAAAGVKEIALTNRNHFRDARKLHERTGAPVRVHSADAKFVEGKEVPVAGPLEPGARIGPFVIIACPGKSPGEVMLYWPERRLLLVGDACVGKAPGQLGLLPEAVMDNPAELRESLRRISKEVDFDTLLTADGHALLEGGRAALESLVASFAAR